MNDILFKKIYFQLLKYRSQELIDILIVSSCSHQITNNLFHLVFLYFFIYEEVKWFETL